VIDVSEAFQEAIIIRMGSDPEPTDSVPFDDAQRTPVDVDSDGIDRLSAMMDFLEFESRMRRVGLPKPIRLACLPLNLRGPLIEKLLELESPA
jgi:hypothetical protein